MNGRPFLLAALGAAVIGAGCDSALDSHPAGLRYAPRSDGPRILFDLDARPLPEIPFPNDLATRPDPTSPTGRRLNLSVIGPTALESTVREKADRLDGFGLYAPITVRFDRAIDVDDLRRRHLDRIVSNDAIYVINVDPDSPGFGERVPIDLGYFVDLPEEMRIAPDQLGPRTGRFPQALSRTRQYFPHDPRAGTSSLLFETVAETDADGDGELDDAEDTDGDGVLDRPNTLGRESHEPGSAAEADALVPFYEFETNTLVIRPVVPLREATTYAVVISRYVTDEQGRPVQSPFLYVNHTRQTKALEPLERLLPRHGAAFDDVVFAWAFTTQSATREMEAIRRGLYGDGPLAWLAEKFPARLSAVWPWRSEKSIAECLERARGDAARAQCQPRYHINVITPEAFLEPLRPFAGELLGSGSGTGAVLDSYRYVDYFVAGTFRAPNFLVDRDGLAADGYPQDDDESFEIDLERGTAVVAETDVTFWCAIPKAMTWTGADGVERRHEPPFPMVFYGHGHGSARSEMLGFAGHHARFGLATCGLDAFGHGLVLDDDDREAAMRLLPVVLKPFGTDAELLLHNFAQGRARDLNNDGVPDSGGDFWTADTFHTRDVLRQSAVEWLQFVRMLRSFDGERLADVDVDGDGALDDVAGDFDGDGKVDLGGWDNDYFGWGQSLGGILTVLAPAVEPALVATAPTAGAGGLTDVAVRSTQGGAVEIVVLRMMGPLVLGDPVYEGEGDAARFTGRYRLRWMVPDMGRGDATIPITEVELEDGDVVVVRNLTREERALLPLPDRRFAVVRAGEGFRVHFAADAWSATEKRARLGFDPREEGFEPLRLDEKQVLASGDRFRIEIFAAGKYDAPRQVVDTWAEDTVWQGTVYPAGAPLVAPAEGMGHRRQTPDLRRFFGIAQAILDGGDPVVYAPRYFLDPIDLTDLEPDRPSETRALVIPTIGDQVVPVNAGLSLARAMGIIDFRRPRADLYGLTEDDFLLATGVYEGTVQYPRWQDEQGPYNFDVDDLDEGTDGLVTDPRGNFRLRLTVKTPQGGISALRLPYPARSSREGDTHGFDISQPDRPFDLGTFMANQVSYFFMMRGQGIGRSQLDQRCLQYLGDDPRACPFMPPYPKPR